MSKFKVGDKVIDNQDGLPLAFFESQIMRFNSEVIKNRLNIK